MVTSRIKPEVSYEKTSKIIDEDLEHSSSVYETEILGKNVEIVLGKKRENEGLAYFVGYVVLDNDKVRPIGIFEIENEKLDNVLDEDGDVDLDEMKAPLLFDNVDLTNSLVPVAEDTTPSADDTTPSADDTTPSADDTTPSADDTTPSADDTTPSADTAPKPYTPLPDANRTTEQSESEVVATGKWIQQFMQNKNYSTIDNEGGGDCLFAAIRDAFEQIGHQYTVGDLRKILSKEVTQEVFDNYRTLYVSFQQSVKETKEELNSIATENNALKEQLPKEQNTKKQIEIVEKAKKLKSRFTRLKEELAISKAMLDEQSFMGNVTSLDQFKAKINTCKFWGDTWAISTLERVLNTKFILLSEESFLSDDMKNVLQCGQLNDVILQEKGVFTPDYYIILDYNGYHYKLITYKDHGIFKFKQLPFAIRDLIVDKCLEKMSGPYAIIPEFASEKLSSPLVEVSHDEVVASHSINSDPETVFMFYGRSNNKPLPGKGTGEKIRNDRRDAYKKLASIQEWRRKLSNEWIAPIDIDGHQWQSVEHFYQGSKYKKSRPDIYYQFTLDSRSELGKSVERAKKFKDFEPDMDFFGKRGKEVLHEALEAKFKQNKDLRQMLALTLDATLMEYQPKKPATQAFELMEIRKNLTV